MSTTSMKRRHVWLFQFKIVAQAFGQSLVALCLRPPVHFSTLLQVFYFAGIQDKAW